jgi:hypothetical protein
MEWLAALAYAVLGAGAALVLGFLFFVYMMY